MNEQQADKQDHLVQNQHNLVKRDVLPIVNPTVAAWLLGLFAFPVFPVFPGGPGLALPENGRAGKHSHRRHALLFRALNIKPLRNECRRLLKVKEKRRKEKKKKMHLDVSKVVVPT